MQGVKGPHGVTKGSYLLTLRNATSAIIFVNQAQHPGAIHPIGSFQWKVACAVYSQNHYLKWS
jgi:hypothetical protein